MWTYLFLFKTAVPQVCVLASSMIPFPSEQVTSHQHHHTTVLTLNSFEQEQVPSFILHTFMLMSKVIGPFMISVLSPITSALGTVNNSGYFSSFFLMTKFKHCVYQTVRERK